MRNVNRTVGTMLGAEVTRRYGKEGLPDGTIHLDFTGSAGQSFGAFLPRGHHPRLVGDANDYLGKGLSGGRVSCVPTPTRRSPATRDGTPAASSPTVPRHRRQRHRLRRHGRRDVPARAGGGAVLRAQLRRAGRRRGRRRPRLEYMTGGRVVVLGSTGRNIAAGMCGGIALRPRPARARVNGEMVDLEALDDEDVAWLHGVVRRHRELTGSPMAQALLDDWEAAGRPTSPWSCRGTTSASSTRPSAPRPRAATPTRSSWRWRVADPRGFLKYARSDAPKRPVEERRADWNELYAPLTDPDRQAETRTQAARCMDCGIPFCHSGSAGCPLGNLIPEWNEYVRVGDWPRAVERLHATNNFPEFTGSALPGAVRGRLRAVITDRNGGPVTIKRMEWSIAEVGWEQELIAPQTPAVRTGKRVAVVGSGPAGLAAAQQLTRAGHDVTVYERDDRIGGLLRYGIPEFKFEKHELDRRLDQMRAEGTRFVVGCEVGGTPSSGTNALPVERLRAEYDAVVLAVGALAARDDDTVPGRELDGIHLAMDYLHAGQPRVRGRRPLADQRPRQERGHHRRRRHRRRLLRHRAPARARIGVHQLDQYPPPPAAATRRARPGRPGPTSCAPPGAGGGRRAPLRHRRPALRRRRRGPRALRRAGDRRGPQGRGRLARGHPDLRAGPRDALRPRALLDRLHRPRRHGAPARPGDRARRRRDRSAAARTGRPTPRASSSAATPTAAPR